MASTTAERSLDTTLYTDRSREEIYTDYSGRLKPGQQEYFDALIPVVGMAYQEAGMNDLLDDNNVLQSAFMMARFPNAFSFDRMMEISTMIHQRKLTGGEDRLSTAELEKTILEEVEPDGIAA